MLFGVPQSVKRFFRPAVASVSKPIRRTLPYMVLAFLLAPHARRLKTLTDKGGRFPRSSVSSANPCLAGRLEPRFGRE
jgi:hypothetical protein